MDAAVKLTWKYSRRPLERVTQSGWAQEQKAGTLIAKPHLVLEKVLGFYTPAELMENRMAAIAA